MKTSKSIGLLIIICFFQVYLIHAANSQSSLDLEASDYIENGSRTYEFTTGLSIPWDATHCGMTITYKAHSQSGTNYKANNVYVEVIKNDITLHQHSDSYNSESSFGTPVPGYFHQVIFQNMDISQGDNIQLFIRVSRGDYKNYISYLKVENCWQIPDVPKPAYDTLAGFQLNYSIWNNPKNGFVEELTESPYTPGEPARRVIFMYDPAPSSKGEHTYSTVSEGMGYALLISYAADDQITFDSFLRYILSISEQGCAALAGSDTESCNIKSKLMPWIVNKEGNPFWYCSNEDQCNFSSGSASDADIQIAYALSLASKKWPGSAVYGQTYSEHLKKMLIEMDRFVFYQSNNTNSWLFSPGNCWGTNGLWVLYPGYLTPHALEAFSVVNNTDSQQGQGQMIPDNGQVIIQNNSPASCHFDYVSSSTKNIQLINPPISDSVLNYYDYVSFNYQVKNFYWAEFRLQCTEWSLQDNQFLQNILGLASNAIPGCNYGVHWENNTWSVFNIESDSQLDKVFCETLFQNENSQNSGILIQLNWPTPIKPNYLSIIHNVETIIQEILANTEFKLVPNVVQLDSNYTVGHDNHGFIVSEWSNQFGYDSVRYIMWLCAYYMKQNIPVPQYLKDMISRIPVSTQGVPVSGWDAKTCQAATNDFNIIPAFIGPLAVASKSIQADNYSQLIQFLNNYNILYNRPAIGKESGPYFNAILYLLCEALLVHDGDFDPPILNVSTGIEPWIIGSVELNKSIESQEFLLTNDGNIDADIFFSATDGQSGWILKDKPDNNAFSVSVFETEMAKPIFLQHAPQFFSTLSVGERISCKIKYSSPILDSIGARNPQNYTIYMKALPHTEGR